MEVDNEGWAEQCRVDAVQGHVRQPLLLLQKLLPEASFRRCFRTSHGGGSYR
jgi:hypothetical protein